MSDNHPPALRPRELLEALERHGVRYVLVGGLGAIVHGYPGFTQDADITPALDTENLNRLGDALWDLKAAVYAHPARTDLFPDGRAPETDDFGFKAEPLRRHKAWHLRTTAGDVDLVYFPEAIGGYDELAERAVVYEAFGVRVPVASLDDIIRSKRALARDKDLQALPLLEQLRDRLRKGPPPTAG